MKQGDLVPLSKANIDRELKDSNWYKRVSATLPKEKRKPHLVFHALSLLLKPVCTTLIEKYRLFDEAKDDNERRTILKESSVVCHNFRREYVLMFPLCRFVLCAFCVFSILWPESENDESEPSNTPPPYVHLVSSVRFCVLVF